MSDFVGYRSSADFVQDWKEKYGEEEKSVFDNFVEFVKQFVQKFRFVG